MPAVISPCVRLCTIDPRTRLCAGCGRTLEEIGRWLSYDEARRRAIIAALPERMARIERAGHRETRS